jgi:hypothetical protein
MITHHARCFAIFTPLRASHIYSFVLNVSNKKFLKSTEVPARHRDL